MGAEGIEGPRAILRRQHSGERRMLPQFHRERRPRALLVASEVWFQQRLYVDPLNA
jgi:hypothetical protein